MQLLHGVVQCGQLLFLILLMECSCLTLNCCRYFRTPGRWVSTLGSIWFGGACRFVYCITCSVFWLRASVRSSRNLLELSQLVLFWRPSLLW